MMLSEASCCMLQDAISCLPVFETNNEILSCCYAMCILEWSDNIEVPLVDELVGWSQAISIIDALKLEMVWSTLQSNIIINVISIFNKYPMHLTTSHLWPMGNDLCDNQNLLKVLLQYFALDCLCFWFPS